MADNKDFLICPACGEFMKKVYIDDAGISVDICVDGCGGIWFDNREELKFDERHESIDEIKKQLEGKTFKKVDQTKDRYCPVCSTETAVKLVKNSTSVKNEIQIDECYCCGGKFFDHGELEAMRNEYKTEKERVAALETLSSALLHKEFAMQEAQLNSIKRRNIVDGLKQLFFKHPL